MKERDKDKKEWKKVECLFPFHNFSKEKVVEGLLVDVRKAGKFNSLQYIIEKDGEKIIVWGSSNLNSQMNFVSVGNEVKIEYKGLMRSSSGRQVKVFDVYYR